MRSCFQSTISMTKNKSYKLIRTKDTANIWIEQQGRAVCSQSVLGNIYHSALNILDRLIANKKCRRMPQALINTHRYFYVTTKRMLIHKNNYLRCKTSEGRLCGAIISRNSSISLSSTWFTAALSV